MHSIRISYLYRDYANYKKHGVVNFSNPNGLSTAEIESTLRKHMLDGTWFLHYQWDFPDLHFEKTDWEDDHPYHEISEVESIPGTDEKGLGTIEMLFEKIKNSNYTNA